jgi:hypothetical protein
VHYQLLETSYQFPVTSHQSAPSAADFLTESWQLIAAP